MKAVSAYFRIMRLHVVVSSVLALTCCGLVLYVVLSYYIAPGSVSGRPTVVPRTVSPTFTGSAWNFEFPASPEKVEDMLNRCRLPPRASTSELLHYWRLKSSAGGKLIDPDFLTSEEQVPTRAIMKIFLDDREFSKMYPGRGPWLRKAHSGLSVSQRQEFGNELGEGHPDQFLSVLAECGVRLSERVRVHGTEYSVRDILAQSMSSLDISRTAPLFTLGKMWSRGITTYVD